MSRKKTKYISAPTTEDLERIEAGEKFSDITAGPVKKALNNALNEDVSEIDQLTQEEEVVAPKKKRKKSLRRAVYFWLGIFVSTMSIIGIVFSANFVVTQVKKIADNTEQKEEFAKYVYPFVIVDVPAFEEGTKLPVEVMLRVAAWDIIINYDAKHSNYTENMGFITVPASDIEVVATRLFGKGIDFDHQTLGDATLYFEYRDETKSYQLPVLPNTMSYRPGVKDIKKINDSTFEITVGYYPLVQDWLPEEKKNVADKFLKYTLVKDGSYYTITSIKEFEGSYNKPI